jgi:hypothetical protein
MRATQADYEVCAQRLKGWVADIIDTLLKVLKSRQPDFAAGLR